MENGTTTMNNKLIGILLVIVAIGYFGSIGYKEYLDNQKQDDKVTLVSNDGKHAITIKSSSNKDGLWYLDNNGTLRYIDKDGNLFKLVKDVPTVNNTKIGQQLGEQK